MEQQPPSATNRSSERGVAIIIALFMTLVMSLLGVSLMFMSQSETWNSTNYRLAGQARYAAESGLQRAANYLLTSYPVPDTAAMASYVTTVSPVQRASNNAQVVLSSDGDVPPNYPVSADQTSFQNTVQGELNLGNTRASYVASAKLLSMQQYTNAYTGTPSTIQTWEITGVGMVPPPRSARVEVSAILGQYLIPLYRYAAFATFNGCEALRFGGGAWTTSYDSTAPDIAASEQSSGGNVGTNGNLTGLGSSTAIHGSLSTPRTGVGSCTTSSVTASTLTGGATITGGIVELSQAVTYPTPTLSATPPTTNTGFGNGGSNTACPSGISLNATCVRDPGTNTWTVTPDSPSAIVTMGNVTVSSGYTLRLASGTYVVNSLTQNGTGALAIGSTDRVMMQVAGQGIADNQAAIDLTGNSISNPSLKPDNFQITYGGTALVKIKGGSTASALIYAPNATATMSGGSDLYGAIITKKVTDMGGMRIHYDRNLQRTMQIASNPMMSAFSWKSS